MAGLLLSSCPGLSLRTWGDGCTGATVGAWCPRIRWLVRRVTIAARAAAPRPPASHFPTCFATLPLPCPLFRACLGLSTAVLIIPQLPPNGQPYPVCHAVTAGPRFHVPVLVFWSFFGRYQRRGGGRGRPWLESHGQTDQKRLVFVHENRDLLPLYTMDRPVTTTSFPEIWYGRDGVQDLGSVAVRSWGRWLGSCASGPAVVE